MNDIRQQYQFFSRFTFTCYFALIGLFVYWGFFSTSGFSWIVLGVQIGPLLILLPGLMTNYYRSFSWLCFIILLYFVVAVDSAFSSAATFLNYLYVILTVLLFISSMMSSRFAQRIQKTSLTPTGKDCND